ncbi:MAG: ImmA/IrrE family metallo-endopeptidase [Solirubrobacteraceae bacterium]
MPRSSSWSEPLVLKLIERHHGREPEEILEGHAERLLRESEQDALPVNVDLIASVLGIRRRVAPFDFAGRIYAEESGQLVMDLNADDGEPRRRFTGAHELMHVAFPGFKRESRYRADASAGGHARNREEEYLCDYGAAALLMPRRLVAERYGIDDGLLAVEALANDAEVSLEAAGNRLVSLSAGPAAFLVLAMSHKPADTPALRRGEAVPECLRLRYATTAHLNLYLPRFKSAGEGSALCRAWEGWSIERGLEHLPGGDGGSPFRVEAKAYGGDENRRVLALARPAA